MVDVDIKPIIYLAFLGIGALVTAAGALVGLVLSLILFHTTGDWHFSQCMWWSVAGVWALAVGYVVGNMVQTWLEDRLTNLGIDWWALLGALLATTSGGIVLAACGFLWSQHQPNPLTFTHALIISEAGAWAFLVVIVLYVIYEKRTQPHD